MYKPRPETFPASIPPREAFDAGDGHPLFLKVEELAAMLRLSKRSVWRLRSAGALPEPYRIGGLVRWRRADIDAWIAGGCVPPPKRGRLREDRRSLQ